MSSILMVNTVLETSADQLNRSAGIRSNFNQTIKHQIDVLSFKPGHYSTQTNPKVVKKWIQTLGLCPEGSAESVAAGLKTWLLRQPKHCDLVLWWFYSLLESRWTQKFYRTEIRTFWWPLQNLDFVVLKTLKTKAIRLFYGRNISCCF